MSDSVGRSLPPLNVRRRAARGLRGTVLVLAIVLVAAPLAGGLLAALGFDVSGRMERPTDRVSDGGRIATLLLPTPPSAPRNLQASGGDGQVTLTWDPPADDGGQPLLFYYIYRGTSSGGESFLIEVPLLTTYVDLTVSNGVTYYYQVSAWNIIGEGPRSNEDSATPGGPPADVPGAPQGLSATGGDGVVDLSWSPPNSDGGSAITHYRIYRGTSSNGESFLDEIGTELSYSDTSVTNGQTYYYKVSARNSVGEGPKSNEDSATPTAPADVPGAPQGLSATGGDGTVALTWSAPGSNGGSPITHYRVYRGNSPNGESFLVELGVVLSYSDGSVTNGQTYYYKVSAVNAVGEGPKSNEDSATPTAPATPPGAPQDLVATAGDATVSLAWSPPASNGGSPITNYKIYRGTTSGQLSLLATVPPNVFSYTDSGLTNGQPYYYQVTAKNAIGEGPPSNEETATPRSGNTTPSPPRELSAVPGNAQVTLTWLAPSSNGGSPITSYKIYRGTAPGGESLVNTLGNVTSYSDTALTNDVAYYYVVRAVNGIGPSEPSTEVSATPTAGPSPPEVPQNVQANPGDRTVTLTWSPPSSNGGSPITSYTVYRGTSSGHPSHSVSVQDATSYTDGGLSNGQKYYYSVAAVNAVGEGPPSPEISARPATIPNAPLNLQAHAGNGNATIQWSGPDSNGGAPVTSYKIYRRTVSGNTSLIKTVLGGVDSYTDLGLTNGETYYYRVGAVNRVGEGPPSSEASVTPTSGPSVPSMPRDLQATAGNGVVTLRWSAPAGDGGSPVVNYTVYRGVSVDDLSVRIPSASLALIDARLTNGVTYYYEVAAHNSVGEGPRSPPVSATPKGPGPGTDTTKPSIAIASPVAGANLAPGPTMITGNASDNVGVARVEVSANGSNWTLATGTTSWSAMINVTLGDDKIYARATDGADNTEVATVTVTVSVGTGPSATGGDIPRSLIVTAILSFAVAAGVAWFVVDRRRKGSGRPVRTRRNP